MLEQEVKELIVDVLQLEDSAMHDDVARCLKSAKEYFAHSLDPPKARWR